MMEVSKLSQKKKKRNRGFKVLFSAHFSFHGNADGNTKVQIFKHILCPKKADKNVKSPLENMIVGEYCPKQSGCCWDYQKKQEEQKEGKHAA